jgi:hypothetical protein
MWLLDPVTRKPLPASDAEARYLEKRRQWSMEPRFVPEYENGIPVRMRWYDPRPRDPVER